jgi:hypothetical protein
MRVVVSVLGCIAALSLLVWARTDNRVRRESVALAATPTTTAVEPVQLARQGPVAVDEDSPIPAIDDPTADIDPALLNGLSFTEVSETAGLVGNQSFSPAAAQLSMSASVAVADVDGDGNMDIFAGRTDSPNVLFHNNGNGTFTDIAAISGLAGTNAAAGYGAASFADIDADGDADLFLAGRQGNSSTLYVNDGSGQFLDETASRGVSIPPAANAVQAEIHGVTFGDYDNDGFLDLLVLQRDDTLLAKAQSAAEEALQKDGKTPSVCETAAQLKKSKVKRQPESPNRSRLFHNDGTGHFTDTTEAMGLDLGLAAAFTGQFVDLNADGWNDLVIAGDYCSSRLYLNRAGKKFVDSTRRAGVAAIENGAGSLVGDFNADGHPDWFVTGVAYPTSGGSCPVTGSVGCSGNHLFLNKGDATFTDVTKKYRVAHSWWAWGAAVADFGADGRQQLAVTNGYFEPIFYGATGEINSLRTFLDRFTADPNRFYVLDGEATTNAAAAAGLAGTGMGRGLVPFDYDNNGTIDLIEADHAGPLRLYRNERPADRPWTTVRLDDPLHPGNRHGLGAKVTIVATANAAPVTGWILDSGSYESQKPAEFSIGLGAGATEIARVEVTWPGASAPQVVEHLPANQPIVITRV